ncbi:PD-(D/E)XK nuclease family protein [Fulvivirga sedimenti]|uniref:PD-(D/E)XK nuclease family protein n=1 Tax=Fulvivirga sedimenti TaxID=2879465 RepID=A0A9X1HU52_9BACT|nr:PD-(D/E)XK nuclease family protein [Fulvivirga sedimenti]MCA6075292.1 PD-(D/E)XK nuclease family protein [Fulvivirga sedimenti]MCA6076469.1 PD-(D/E)XK nuclease family protein [Fulvivirga sedimenti]MCA6077597.1 PD-(D/E)XK nuclease family protein [Fulvivirga sedimenti]
MKGFLYQVAEELIREHGDDMSRVTVVFPNQRAGLYLRQILRTRAERPVWAPSIISFRELVQRESNLVVPDALFLTFELYKVYHKIIPTGEAFEDFYFWGQMLLRDFDEIDKYLVPAQNIYKDLSRQKELDMAFDFLSEEQKALIQSFWRGFDGDRSESQEQFLKIWNRLNDVYDAFTARLKEDGYCYEGSMYRQLAENVETHSWRQPGDILWFAGFNALTFAEEKIVKHLLGRPTTRIFWDVDEYYVNDKRQEAGRFIRAFRHDRQLKHTIPEVLPAMIGAGDQEVQIIGVPQYVGQAKLCSSLLQKTLEQNPELDQRRIAVVLADETLLLPVLHSLPESVQTINITMGFPLIYAPLSGFIELISELHLLARKQDGEIKFHYRQILAIENHPMMTDHLPAERPWKNEHEQRLYWNIPSLAITPLYRKIFADTDGDFVSYLISILEELSVISAEQISNSHIHYFLKHLNRYREMMDYKIGVDTFRRLFRQLVRMDKIPFTGEPLEGLQIMGVLETRNLDFDHIFVLGMNEESFPAGKNKHSYIPYNLRKAYDLPHFDQQDAIYAYLFYRLLHNAGKAIFIYNTEGDDLGGEEMSRFLKQLIYERPMKVSNILLRSKANAGRTSPIMVPQDEETLGRLSRYTGRDTNKRLAPSAMNTYLDCSLKFFFRYVARLYESDELEDNVDARTLGSLIHEGIEFLYTPYLGKEVSPEDVKKLKPRIKDAVIAGFRKRYKIEDGEQYEPEGKNIIAASVAEKFLLRILDKDEAYAPFKVLGLEKKVEGRRLLKDGIEVYVGGTVDRIDMKDGLIRIVDFKTGSDSSEFDGLDSLFQEKRNKAAFQTMFYAVLYLSEADTDKVIPAVYNRDVLFQDADPLFYDKKLKSRVTSLSAYRQYEQELDQLLGKIFSPSAVYVQTENSKICEYCPYNMICQRV